nr:hypothetical protein [Tanacetum cinerariifolium]
SKTPQSSGKYNYFLYVPAFDPLSINNISIPDPITLTIQVINSLNKSLEFLIADDHPFHHEPDDFEPSEFYIDTSDS